MSANQRQKIKPIIDKNVKIVANSDYKKSASPELKFPDQYYPSTDSGIKNEEIDRIWKIIDDQIKTKSAVGKSKQALNELKAVRRFKVIRVFVSSTFTDYFNEREVLVKQVFPELREWCSERNMDLIECDLRWGVPSDSTSDQTILTCLSELDRCHKENDGQPFFIGMLSEKYGWVPDFDKLSDEIKIRYDWAPKVSITSMEFLHGALRCRNKNACFFIRSPDSLKDIPPEYHEKIFESNDFSKQQLETLKQKLKQYHPNQVFDYSCKYDGIDETTGRKKVKLGNLAEFGQKVLDFLKNSIESFYPDCQTMVNDEDKEDNLIDEKYQQDLYLIDRTSFFLNREKEFNSIMDFILKNKITSHFSLTANDQQIVRNENDKTVNRPLIILGAKGSGKSTLIAQITKKLIEIKKDVFYYFYDASVLSRFSRYFMGMFCLHFSKKFNLEHEPINLDYDSSDIVTQFKRILEELGKITKEEIIIIVDGYVYDHQAFLECIPRNLPANFRLIYTCTATYKSSIENILGGDVWLKFELNEFDRASSRNFIETYLGKYNKKLDEKQMNLLLSKSDSTMSPLWLSYVCNELRVFGEFTTVSKRIELMSLDLKEILLQIIERINSDFRDNIIKEALCLIGISCDGIPENEMCLLLNSVGLDVNRLEWSQMSRSLKLLLSFKLYSKTHLITLNRDEVFETIKKQIIGNDYDRNVAYHKKLVDFFKNKSTYRSYAIIQTCYHYDNANLVQEFIDFLKSPECQQNANDTTRAFYFNKLRCPFMVDKKEANALKMCIQCSMKIGTFNYGRMNQQSCFVCGSWVMGQKRYVYKCQRHDFNERHLPPNNFKCCVCERMCPIIANMPAASFVRAEYCSFCYNNQCCMFKT